MTNMTASTAPHSFFSEPLQPTAVLVLEDGTAFYGQGFGAEKTNVGEVCFNTSMTGYQEIMTDRHMLARL